MGKSGDRLPHRDATLCCMPLIVIGADTGPGTALVEALDASAREIRVFVTNESRGLELKKQGFKVATGDVSDQSHVEAASTRCFSAVLIDDAAHDDRERSFADSPEATLQGWADAITRSRVKRVIWITAADHPESEIEEVAVVDPSDPDFVGTVIELDEAQSIT